MLSNIPRPPKGFTLDHTLNGYPIIKYRTTGKIASGVFYAIGLAFWTFACVGMTIHAFNTPGGIKLALLYFSIPFWAAEFFVIGYVIWYFGNKRIFEFNSDKLIVARTCWKYKKQREILKNKITKIRQVKDDRESAEEGFSSWGIVIEADKRYKILYGQKVEKSEWLGRFIEDWAKKEYVPWHDELKDVELI